MYSMLMASLLLLEIRMEKVEEGFKFAERQYGLQYAVAVGDDYIADINDAIDDAVVNLTDLAQRNINKNNKQLGGDIAEIWHEGTFNINAAIKRSTDHATAGRVNTLGSPDVVLDSGAEYSLKYYASAMGSGKAQAASPFFEYRSNGGKKSIEEYLQMHPEFTREQALGSPLYEGQYRLIPDDQLEEAKAWLRRKALDEIARGDGQEQRYIDAYNMLAQKNGHAVIDNGHGVHSIPLTKHESTELAQLAKENNIDPQRWGLTTENLVSFDDILQGSFKAGTSAALIDMVFKVAPEIFKAIDYLIKTGEIDLEAFKKVGVAAISGAAQGFIVGSISYAITASCKAGMLGQSLKNLDPHVAGAIAVVAFDTLCNAIKVARGEMSLVGMVGNFTQDAFVSACMLAGGAVLQPVLGPLGYLLGSILGSAVGGLAYSMGRNIVLSLCVNHGFTAFGLVEQNYKLPEGLLRKAGFPIFESPKFEYKKFQTDVFKAPSFEFKHFDYETIGITILKRGFIDISTVGYTLA